MVYRIIQSLPHSITNLFAIVWFGVLNSVLWTFFAEAGHALVGALMPEYDPVAKISIIPRGQAGSLTFFAPSEERLESGLYSRSYLENQMAVALGGRLVEQLFSFFTSQALSSAQKKRKSFQNAYISLHLVYNIVLTLILPLQGCWRSYLWSGKCDNRSIKWLHASFKGGKADGWEIWIQQKDRTSRCW